MQKGGPSSIGRCGRGDEATSPGPAVPLRTIALSSAAPLPSQLPCQRPRKSSRRQPNYRASVTHVGYLEDAPASWFWNVPATVAIQGVNQRRIFPTSPFLYHSDFQEIFQKSKEIVLCAPFS